MPEFLTTTVSGKKPHKHIIYRLDDGTGLSSPHKDGSQHVIIREQQPVGAMQGVLAQNMLPQIQTPAVSERLSLAPDGHTHEILPLEEYSAPSKIESETDEEKIDDVTTMYKDASLYEKDAREKGRESKDFLAGNQWPKEIKEYLESCNRACLTINQVEPNHDVLSGIFRDNRTDFKALPVENGDSITADILSIVMKQVTNLTGYTQEENQVFDDVQDTGRGFFEIFMDYDKDIQGQIRIGHIPWDRVYCGPHDKLDGSDMEYVIKKDWFSYKKMKQLWPEKVEDIDKMVELTQDEIRTLREEPGAKFAIVGAENLEDLELSDHSNKKYAVLECERKVYRTVKVIIDEDTGFVFDGGLLSPKDLADALKIKEFRTIQRNIHDIRVTIIAGCVVLDDFIADRPTNDFSVIPVYCKKSGKDFWGKIEAIKDAQRELNKRRSQNTDIMDRCVIDGFFTDQNTFVNKQDEEDFEENVAKPGFHQKIQDLKNPPLKISANPFPTGVVQMETMAGDSVRKISGVTLEMAGMEENSTNSGVLFAAKQRQGMVSQKFLFDNFAIAKKRLGKQIVQYIQDNYTADRILRLIMSSQSRENGIMVGGTDLGTFPVEQLAGLIQQALDNQDLLKFDIEISESPYSSTARQTSALLMLEMARSQPGIIPPDLIIDAFDMPGKQKVLARLAQFQQQQMQQEQAKNDTEIQKTLIAANAKKQENVPNEPNLPNEVPLQEKM